MSWRLRSSSSSDVFIGSAAWCAHQPIDPVSLSTLRYANSDRYSTDLNNYTRLFSGIRRRACTSVDQTCQMPAAGRRAAHHRTKNYFQARSRSAVFSNHPLWTRESYNSQRQLQIRHIGSLSCEYTLFTHPLPGLTRV